MERLVSALLQQAGSAALSLRVICRVPIRLIAYASRQLKSTLNPMPTKQRGSYYVQRSEITAELGSLAVCLCYQIVGY